MKFIKFVTAGQVSESGTKGKPMPIDFKILSMMDLRAKPGEVLDDVARNGQAFVIERNSQQKACLVPVSFFLPDIQTERIAHELEKLTDAAEHYRLTVTDTREIQLIFHDLCSNSEIDVTVTLPHGYPNSAPIVSAKPIDSNCPHLWKDGSLCIYGMMDTWNPGRNDILHVLNLCRRWISSYQVWKQSEEWPKNGN